MIKFYIGLAISAALLIAIIILIIGKRYQYTILHKDVIYVIPLRKNYRGIYFKPHIDFIPASKISMYQNDIKYSKTLPDYAYVLSVIDMFTAMADNLGLNLTEE